MDEPTGSEQPDTDSDTELRSRTVPPLLSQAWETATGDDDPLVALGATRALRAHLSTWEAQLVKEAMADGATWETIGTSVGVSRQAAWDRFHHEVHDLRRQMHQDVQELRRRYRDEARELHRKYRGAGRRPSRGGRGRGRSRTEDAGGDTETGTE
jgi:hypothetical protein